MTKGITYKTLLELISVGFKGMESHPYFYREQDGRIMIYERRRNDIYELVYDGETKYVQSLLDKAKEVRMIHIED